MGVLAVAALLGSAEDSPRKQYEALVKEYREADKAADDAYAKAATHQEQVKASRERLWPKDFAPRFFAIAQDHRDDPAALDALIWVESHCALGAEAAKALGLIARDHARSDRLKDFCEQGPRYGEAFPAYEEMLKAVIRDSPHREIKGATCLTLAEYLRMARERTESNFVRIASMGERSLGPDQLKYARKMQERGLDAVADEAAALYQTVIDDYGDLRLKGEHPPEVAERAKEGLFLLRNLCIGQKAPEILGKDIHGKPMKLSDFRGKIVVLDFGSHRSCGVCRAMYPELRSMVKEYKENPFALLGISVDDDVKELAALAEKGEITWPMWWDGEDLEGPLASQWVIRLMPTFYVLDPNGVIRTKGFLQPVEIKATVNMLLKEPIDEKP
jgi:peroxiredoxin